MQLFFLFRKVQQVMKIRDLPPCFPKGDHPILKPIVWEKEPKLRDGRWHSQTQMASVQGKGETKSHTQHAQHSTCCPCSEAGHSQVTIPLTGSPSLVPSTRWPQAALATLFLGTTALCTPPSLADPGVCTQAQARCHGCFAPALSTQCGTHLRDVQ